MNYPLIIFLGIIYIIIDIFVYVAVSFFDVEDFRQFTRFFCYMNFVIAVAIITYSVFRLVLG